jgi:hypothetical protein
VLPPPRRPRALKRRTRSHTHIPPTSHIPHPTLAPLPAITCRSTPDSPPSFLPAKRRTTPTRPPSPALPADNVARHCRPASCLPSLVSTQRDNPVPPNPPANASLDQVCCSLHAHTHPLLLSSAHLIHLVHLDPPSSTRRVLEPGCVYARALPSPNPSTSATRARRISQPSDSQRGLLRLHPAADTLLIGSLVFARASVYLDS